MPNVAAILKQEISRVARRDVRSLTKSLHKASAQFRRDIPELKRRSSKAQAEITRLGRSNGNALPLKAAEVETANFRFSVKSVKSQRNRLGISAPQYAKLIGVSAPTVYPWEHGTSKPRRTQWRLGQLDGKASKKRN